MIRAKGLDTLIEVDGGVNLETGKRCWKPVPMCWLPVALFSVLLIRYER